MATSKPAKKATTKPASKPASKKVVKKAAAKPAALNDLTGEQLVVENLSTLSTLVRTLSETLDVLVQKVENMAYHLIATEEVLGEVITSTGLDLAKVNARIRHKISDGTDNQGDPTRAIDIAATIASPRTKFKK